MVHSSPLNVVAGVGPDTSPATVDAAAAEASLRGLPLQLIAVRSEPAGPDPSLTGMLHRACTGWPGLAASARIVVGEPATVLTAASRGAALVVVGRGRQRPGVLATQVAAHALCPTLVVPPHAPTRTEEPVLLGLAVAPDEEPTIGFAFEAADLRHAPLIAVHVWSGLPGNALGALSPFAYDLHEAYAAADRMVAETVAGWADKYPDVTLDRMPLYDVNPARTLLDASALAGLVVVGARRGGMRSSLLVGSVARTLIERAACPVAIVRSHPSWSIRGDQL